MLPLDGLEEEEEEAAGGFEPVDFRIAVPSREGPARAVLDEGALMNVGFFAVLVGPMGFACAAPEAEDGVDERAPTRAEGEGSKEATRASMRVWWVQ